MISGESVFQIKNNLKGVLYVTAKLTWGKHVKNLAKNRLEN